MDEREKLIAKLIEEKGGSRKDYLNLLDSIAYHESASTMDPTLKQYGGGPGRGKYQFETGKHKGAITAAKRTASYFTEKGIPVPKWLSTATKGDDLDVSKLSSEQQDVLFLGNMRKHPKADFSKVWKGDESIKDFWANYHWAGDVKDRAARTKAFDSSLEGFKQKRSVPSKENTIVKKDLNNNPQITKQEMNDVYSYIKQLNSNKKAMGGSLNDKGCGGPGQPPCVGKKKVGLRDLTDEEAITEAEGSQFNQQGIQELFGADVYADINRNPLNLGKYGKVNYFKPEQSARGEYTLRNTKQNPANYDLYKQQTDLIKRLNPDASFSREGFTPLINQKAMGGNLNVEARTGETNVYGTGGTHEANPYGGVKIGMGQNGLPNTVEEDEVSHNFDDGKYIFSNRLYAGGKVSKKY